MQLPVLGFGRTGQDISEVGSGFGLLQGFADMIKMFTKEQTMPDVADLVAKGLFKREYRDHRLEWMIKSGGVDVVLKGLERDNIRFAPPFG